MVIITLTEVKIVTFVWLISTGTKFDEDNFCIALLVAVSLSSPGIFIDLTIHSTSFNLVKFVSSISKSLPQVNLFQ